VVPARLVEPVTDVLLVERTAASRRGHSSSAARSARSRGEDLVGEHDLASGRAAELELRVGEHDAVALGVLGGESVDSSDRRRSSSIRLRSPTISAARSKSMFSSWSPSSALVAGVKIGSGRRSDSRDPGGSAIPHTEPSRWYSFQPDPDR